MVGAIGVALLVGRAAVAGPPQDAVAPPSTEAPSAKPTESSAVDAPPLDRRIQQLEQALHEPEALAVPLASLFGFDPSKPEHVAKRVQELRALIQTTVTSTAAATPSTSDDLRRKAWRLELEFLEMPDDLRAARVHADDARRRQQRAQAAAKERAAEAERTEAAAEAAAAKALAGTPAEGRLPDSAWRQHLAVLARQQAELARQDRRLSSEQAQVGERMSAQLAQVEQLLQQELNDKTPVEAHLTAINAALERSVDELTAALNLQIATDPVLVEPEPTPDLPEPTNPEERSAAAKYHLDRVALENYRAEVIERHVAFSKTYLDSALHQVQTLAGTRARVLRRHRKLLRPYLSLVHSAGRREARREITVLIAEGKALPIIHGDHLRRIPAMLERAATSASLIWFFVRLLGILGGFWWLRRQGPRLRRWFDTRVLWRTRSLARLRWLGLVKRHGRSFAGPLLYLFTVLGLRLALPELAPYVEIDLAFTVALWIGYYRVVRAALETTLLWLLRRRSGRGTPEIRAKLESSVKLVAQTFLVFGLLDSVALRLLRYGTLFKTAETVLFGGAAVLGVVLLHRWRDAITTAYLAHWSKGRLATLVEKMRDHPLQLAVVAAALVYVLLFGAADLARDFVLGFDQSRKALAFFFRRRLERQAAKAGAHESCIEDLPESIRFAFSTAPLSDLSMAVDHFPDLDRLKKRWETLLEGGRGEVRLIVGDRGIGKTTWLHRAAAISEAPAPVLLSLHRGHDWRTQLAEALGLSSDPSPCTDDDLQTALRNAAPRILLVDDLQHIFLRGPDGTRWVRGFLEFVQRTATGNLWVLSCNRWAWRHMSVAPFLRHAFSDVTTLKPWSESALRDLLMSRALASGIVHEFGQLVTAPSGRQSEERLLDASEGYTRLIWDLSGGSPAVALRYWLHSLEPVGPEKVRVHMLSDPEESTLMRLGESALFVYACLCLHGPMTNDELAQSLRIPLFEVQQVTHQGLAYEHLKECREGRFDVHIDWQPKVIRALRSRRAL